MKSFSSKKKNANANASSTTATEKTALLVYYSVSHYYCTTQVGHACRQYESFIRRGFFLHVSIASNLALCWKLTLQLESSPIIKHKIVDLINTNV